MRVLIVTLFAAIACFGIAQAAEVRTTAEVDRGRIAEFDSIFGTEVGVVMGYTAADHDVQVNAEAEVAEGDTCGAHESCGCCCKVKCCKPKCGCNKCGGGCNTCHKDTCCPCGGHGKEYDCWGVWSDVTYSSENTRDSDNDPVLGDGGRGTHSFFGWGGW